MVIADIQKCDKGFVRLDSQKHFNQNSRRYGAISCGECCIKKVTHVHIQSKVMENISTFSDPYSAWYLGHAHRDVSFTVYFSLSKDGRSTLASFLTSIHGTCMMIWLLHENSALNTQETLFLHNVGYIGWDQGSMKHVGIYSTRLWPRSTWYQSSSRDDFVANLTRISRKIVSISTWYILVEHSIVWSL